MWSTLGHENQKSFLDQALSKNQYAHAYLFCGPDAVGKKTLALEFANKILSSENAKTPALNPDLIILDQEKLKIENIRDLISELSLKPYFYKHKVAVIDNFENANLDAANSILKTLEEPNSSTIIILICKNKKALLPTIVSRTQVFNFSRLTSGEMKALSGKEEEKYLHLFNGRIGKMLLFQKDLQFRKSFLENAAALKKIKSAEKVERLSFLKEYADWENKDIANLLDTWIDSEQSDLFQNPSGYKNLQLFSDALSGLSRNFNKKMILQRIFLEMV